MRRRTFITNSSSIVLGLGAFGNVNFTDGGYVGDDATTSDILGPFYRPGAPLRKNLNPKNFAGEILNLSGTVFKEDGTTPVSNCVVEIWQCQADGLYDNVSDEYTYRAKQKTIHDGKYHFITTQPVAYPIEENSSIFRPAHIHMRISAIGEQDLITQIYFTGDRYLDGDPSIQSQLAIKRILSLKKNDQNQSDIKFDIVLKKQKAPGDDLIKTISGVYKMSNNTMMEFYRDGDLLFYKTNNQIWGALSYAGNNRFEGGANDTEAVFEPFPNGKSNVKFRFIRRRKLELEGTKVLVYGKE